MRIHIPVLFMARISQPGDLVKNWIPDYYLGNDGLQGFSVNDENEEQVMQMRCFLCGLAALGGKEGPL
jgi:hypothetical protein